MGLESVSSSEDVIGDLNEEITMCTNVSLSFVIGYLDLEMNNKKYCRNKLCQSKRRLGYIDFAEACTP